jgi:mono/diheme cytochrome c family protein
MWRMNMKGKPELFLTFLAIVLVLGFAAHVQGQGRRFKSPGERIYHTGIGVNGYPIPIYGGPMWLRMHGGGCVSCHGIHGRGGVPVMMGTAIPTDIRYEALTGKEKHIHEGKEKEHHYTDALIKRAITQGLEADGEVMDWTMPRWQMSEADLDALIEYLKTLE